MNVTTSTHFFFKYALLSKEKNEARVSMLKTVHKALLFCLHHSPALKTLTDPQLKSPVTP